MRKTLLNSMNELVLKTTGKESDAKSVAVAVQNIAENYNGASKDYVDQKATAVYKYKGSVADYASLPSTGNVVGDVYNVISTGDNYAWDGTAWDKLAGFVIANPSGEAVQDLTKLQIGDTIYAIPSGSGGGSDYTLIDLESITNPKIEDLLNAVGYDIASQQALSGKYEIKWSVEKYGQLQHRNIKGSLTCRYSSYQGGYSVQLIETEVQDIRCWYSKTSQDASSILSLSLESYFQPDTQGIGKTNITAAYYEVGLYKDNASKLGVIIHNQSSGVSTAYIPDETKNYTLQYDKQSHTIKWVENV